MNPKTIIVLAVALLLTNPFKALTQNLNTAGNASIESAIDELKNENKKLSEKNAELENRLNQIEKDLSQCCMSFQSAIGSRQSAHISSLEIARLEQNTPNPFKEKTAIRYYIPTGASSAFIKIYSLFGSELLSFPVTLKGFGQIEFSGKTLSAGTFTYILIVDGKAMDTKQMVLTK
jgi:hypothetical protein